MNTMPRNIREHMIGMTLLAFATACAGSLPQEDRILSDNVFTQPPGMVQIESGNTVIGSPGAYIQELLQGHPELLSSAPWFLAETPGYSTHVPGYFLMTTEVTNEQYYQFVLDSGTRPPIHWGREAIDEARELYLLGKGEQVRAARKEGRKAVESEAFNEGDWWRENWQDCDWKLPVTDHLKPVTFVEFEDARAYADWAGLRLPDEFEFERAGRGNSLSVYPWGSEWFYEYAATSETRAAWDLSEVGSHPSGDSIYGIHDLAGSVLEWTTSVLSPYPAWTENEMLVSVDGEMRSVPTHPVWDPDLRVARGGSIGLSRHYARCSMRLGLPPSETAEFLGFRCAASLTPGLDKATSLIREMPEDVFPSDQSWRPTYETSKLVATNRWSTVRSVRSSECEYAVISSHDYIIFVPILMTHRERFDVEQTSSSRVAIGLFATSVRITSPPLAPGSYIAVVYLGQTESKQRSTSQNANRAEGIAAPQQRLELAIAEAANQRVFDQGKDTLLFFTLSGEAVGAIPIRSLSKGNKRSCTLRLIPPTEDQVSKREGLGTSGVRLLGLCIPARTHSDDCVRACVRLQVESGAFGV